MLNRSASLAMSTSVLKALPGKLDIKRHSPSILYVFSALQSQITFSALLTRHCYTKLLTVKSTIYLHKI